MTTLRDRCGELWQVIARFQDERGSTRHMLNEIRTLEPAGYLEPLWEALRQRFPEVEAGEAPLTHPAPSVHTI